MKNYYLYQSPLISENRNPPPETLETLEKECNINITSNTNDNT